MMPLSEIARSFSATSDSTRDGTRRNQCIWDGPFIPAASSLSPVRHAEVLVWARRVHIHRMGIPCHRFGLLGEVAALELRRLLGIFLRSAGLCVIRIVGN